MSAAEASMSISELAEAAGVTPRTIRFYVAEGLLPPPSGAGAQREYSSEHLLRLRAIKRLKGDYLPLTEIRRRLAYMSLEQLENLVRQPEPPPPASALEYLAKVMPRMVAERSAPIPSAAPSAPMPSAGAPGGAPFARSVELAQPATAAAPPRSSDWRRIELAPGIELHVRVSRNPARESALRALAADFAQKLVSLPPENSGDVRP